MPDPLSIRLQALGFALVETHISRVYLRGEDVYKTKRAVNLGFLDFSTLEDRLGACQAEVELNRRLAPEVYLGVIAITRDARGELEFLAPECVAGRPVLEWAVHMRRLSDETRADQLLTHGAFGAADIACIARLLADFHGAARRDHETAGYGMPECVAGNVTENFAQTRSTIAEYLDPSESAALESYQCAFLREEADTFRQRAQDGCVRDGHGDLRLEHFYRAPTGSYVVIDCIEFNQRFRYADVAADLAFLSMDLAVQGRSDHAEQLIASYARESADYGLYRLVDFYQSYRAVVRAKVSAMLAHDDDVSELARDRAAKSARRYYLSALAAARPPLQPARIIVAMGMIASGKSTMADALGAASSWPVLSSDRTRKELLGVASLEPLTHAPFAGAYAPETSERVYQTLLARAELILNTGRSVILDATFCRRHERAQVKELAARLGCGLTFVECRCPAEVAMARLAARAQSQSISDGRAELFAPLMRDFEATSELAAAEYVELDTTRPVEANVQRVLGRFA